MPYYYVTHMSSFFIHIFKLHFHIGDTILTESTVKLVVSALKFEITGYFDQYVFCASDLFSSI